MTDFGGPPDCDEVEVSIFGPGYGEAIAVHLGEMNWLLVDSCDHPDSELPASLHYLKSISVPPDRVVAVVATHWHDDHISGLRSIVETCTNAEFFLSGLFNESEAMAFLRYYADMDSNGLTSGCTELFRAARTSARPFFLYQRTTLTDLEMSNGRKVRITAFTPSVEAQAASKARMAKFLPEVGTPRRSAPNLSPNLESVVIHIDLGDDAILLGADLEEHKNLGWASVVKDPWCSRRTKASLYKVAHHGSSTGHNDGIWKELLTTAPFVAMTPFVNGRVRLPTASDRARIKGLSGKAFVSSGASKKPAMEHDIEKRLGDIASDIAQLHPGFGSVRFRKSPQSTAWTIETFGAAEEI